MRAVTHRSGAALAVVAALSLLAACGSGSVAQDAKNAASGATEKLAAATTTTTTETVTQPNKTVTTPAKTVTRTETTTVPGNTTSIQRNTTSVKVTPATTTTGNDSSGGIPAWGWVLIGAGAVLLVVAIFMIGRSRGTRARHATGATDPNRPPDSAAPPRGPPEDPI